MASVLSITSPLQGTIWQLKVAVGDEVSEGQELIIIESMKMEHPIKAPESGVISMIRIEEAGMVTKGEKLLELVPQEISAPVIVAEGPTRAIQERADLAEVHARHAKGYDGARPDRVAKRRARNQRTARENIADLIDEGSLVEYGPLVIAPQRRRRELQDLIDNTPADGMVSGIATVNGEIFDEQAAQTVVISYDYMVLAGTQGGQNHRKKDRMFELAERQQLPVVFFTEGGGGRPGDTDGVGFAGLDCLAFAYWGKLSGLVPMIGINSGYCFAGNAAILACCDVIIATEDSHIGMAGPAMIEGGGLGSYHPTEIGPIDVQEANGVVDIRVADEAEGVAVAKKYLSYFQGRLPEWQVPDQDALRHVVPENRKQIYDMRDVIDGLFDVDSVLELRPKWGDGMITCLARMDGRPVGVIANNPHHLGGAIDATAADKSARFMQLCEAHDLPIVFLCDTPGFMVGPESEQEGMVRRAGRLFVVGASLSVPFMTIITRKGYGLGAQGMTGGGFKQPLFTVAWPTGEVGGMGLEGAVALGYRKELEAVKNLAEREVLYDKMVDKMYEHGKAVSAASYFEFDDVIDPADSRKWIMTALRSAPSPEATPKRHRPVDTV
jgi:acetyl-CoA carboxylase carboxyltransferase component